MSFSAKMSVGWQTKSLARAILAFDWHIFGFGTAFAPTYSVSRPEMGGTAENDKQIKHLYYYGKDYWY